MKTSSLLFLVTTVGILICHFYVLAQPEFIQHQVTNTFTKGADVIATDLNQDGYMDIVGVNTDSNGEISWWKNDGFNEFTKITIRDNLNSVRSVTEISMFFSISMRVRHWARLIPLQQEALFCRNSSWSKILRISLNF